MRRPGPALELDSLPVRGAYRLRGLEMTRLETFTDAAFAFALTLLVISLDPPRDTAALLDVMQEIPAFLVSATLLMTFWWGHHQWSRRFGLDDGPTVVLSCMLVFTVLIYVVPLRLMFGMLFAWIDYLTGLPIGAEGIGFTDAAGLNAMFAVYGMGFAAMSGALLLLNAYALKKGDELRLDALEVHETRAEVAVWFVLAASGVVSTLVALVAPSSVLGLPGWVYMMLPVAISVVMVRADRKRRKIEETLGGADE